MNQENKHKHIAIEAIGWIGAVLIVFGFMLNSFDVIDAQSYEYQLLNLVGATGVVFVSLYKKVYQTAALNGFLVLVSLIAIAGIIRGGL